MKTKQLKECKGITLVSLVITVIVLIILAAVSISALRENSGVVTQSQNSKSEVEEASIKQGIEIAYMSSLEPGTGKVTYDVFNKELEKLGFDRGVQQADGSYSNDIKLISGIININDKIYTISSNGKVGGWIYKEDEEKRKTIITNGTIDLPIGTYINYNEKVKDVNGNYYSYTSPMGTHIPDNDGAVSTEIEQGSGYKSAQTFSCNVTTSGWKVLGADEDGQILIISADPIGTYYLRGYTGYQFGVQELNNICEIFGNGNGATGARSVNIYDINKITGYNPNNVEVDDPEQTTKDKIFNKGTLNEYDNKVTYTWNMTTSGKVDYTATNGIIPGTLDNSHSSHGFNWYDSSSKSWKNNKTYTGEITNLTLNYYYYFPNSLGKNDVAGNGLNTTDTETTSYKAYATMLLNKKRGKISY